MNQDGDSSSHQQKEDSSSRKSSKKARVQRSYLSIIWQESSRPTKVILTIGIVLLFLVGFRPITIKETRSFETRGPPSDVAITRNHAYITEGKDGLEIVNISNPSDPKAVGMYETNGRAWKIVLKGNYAYVINSTNGLEIIDTSNPFLLQKIDQYEFGRNLMMLEIVDDFIYLLDQHYGLMIIQIINYTILQEIDYYYVGGTGRDVTIFGDYAYVITGLGKLFILNISNPENITLESITLLHSGNVEKIQVAFDFAYIATSSNLIIFNVSDPSNPKQVGNYQTEGSTSYIDVIGVNAYLLDRIRGLSVIDISDPSRPKEIAGSHASSSYLSFKKDHRNYYIAKIYDHNIFIIDRNHGLVIVSLDADEDGYLLGDDAYPDTRWLHAKWQVMFIMSFFIGYLILFFAIIQRIYR